MSGVKSISIIIVSWNTRGLLQGCLDSIRAAKPLNLCETIVVDNASNDGSPDMVRRDYPEVTLIQSPTNLGFGRANNLAMARASGEYFALVNSDALVHPECLEMLSRALQARPDLAVAGPRVQGHDGKLQRSCRKLPTLWNTLCRTLALDRCLPEHPWFCGYELPSRAHETGGEVEVISGCFCVVRRSAVDEVGGFDERFFFYGEDLDWCKRFGDAGWKLALLPGATATHFGGGSSGRAPIKYSIEILRATLAYWKKHHGALGQFACRALLILHHGLRLAMRSALRMLGRQRPGDASHKLREDWACLRWLVGLRHTRLPATPPLESP